MSKYRIQLVLMITLAIIALSLILSLNANPNIPPLFTIKRAQETVFLKLKPNLSDKVDYMRAMLDSRLNELGEVVKVRGSGKILTSSSRYSTLAGQITDLIIENKMTDKVESVKAQFLNHKKILDALYVAYPKNTDDWEWKFIQDDFNYLKLYLDKLEKI